MKNTFLVSYDKVEGGDYEKVHLAFKAYGTWAHITETLYAISTEQTAPEVRDNIEQYLPTGSRLFVVKSGTVAAWRNVICSNEWLKEKL